MRREISSVSAVLNWAGAVRSVLSRVTTTSAELRAGRLLEPEKITSSMPEARMALYELSPITQRSASTRLDFPHPFGPTTPVSPGSNTSSTGSVKDLKPVSLRRENFIGRLGGNILAQAKPAVSAAPSSDPASPGHLLPRGEKGT